MRFKATLSFLADNATRQPVVTFRRKIRLNSRYPADVFVRIHENGSMDEDGMSLLMGSVWINGQDVIIT
ncbi:hypothetical protein M513_14013, partial [Trichuris suis]